jgi:hypothetical protein
MIESVAGASAEVACSPLVATFRAGSRQAACD